MVLVLVVEDAIEHLIERLRSYPDEPETLEDGLEHFLNAHYDFSGKTIIKTSR